MVAGELLSTHRSGTSQSRVVEIWSTCHHSQLFLSACVVHVLPSHCRFDMKSASPCAPEIPSSILVVSFSFFQSFIKISSFCISPILCFVAATFWGSITSPFCCYLNNGFVITILCSLPFGFKSSCTTFFPYIHPFFPWQVCFCRLRLLSVVICWFQLSRELWPHHTAFLGALALCVGGRDKNDLCMNGLASGRLSPWSWGWKKDSVSLKVTFMEWWKQKKQ